MGLHGAPSRLPLHRRAQLGREIAEAFPRVERVMFQRRKDAMREVPGDGGEGRGRMRRHIPVMTAALGAERRERVDMLKSLRFVCGRASALALAGVGRGHESHRSGGSSVAVSRQRTQTKRATRKKACCSYPVTRHLWPKNRHRSVMVCTLSFRLLPGVARREVPLRKQVADRVAGAVRLVGLMQVPFVSALRRLLDPRPPSALLGGLLYFSNQILSPLGHIASRGCSAG